MTKTNAELADRIQYDRAWLTEAEWARVIAALRRGHERIDAKMADLLVDITWRKAVGQCINGICGLDGTTLGKSCGRLFISRERFDEHIAPLIRQPLIRQQERPPSGEMVMGLRVVVNPSVPADEVWITNAHGKRLGTIVNLSAAEAEGRKS